MAIASDLLTYEQYMAEGEVFKRYDILDGVRIFMTNPTRRHQEILGNLFIRLQAYERTTRRGKAILAPCDVLVQRKPLRTRQPDVLFISHERLQRCASAFDPAPLFAAPELVVEILSPSETSRTREDKIADYRSVDVKECWVVDPVAETVEVLRLTPERAESVGTYGVDQTVRSLFYPDLTVPVADVFAS